MISDAFWKLISCFCNKFHINLCYIHSSYISLKTIELLIAYKNKCKKVYASMSISENRRYWYLWQMGEGFIAWSFMWDTCTRRAWNLFLWKAAEFSFYVRRSRRVSQNDAISRSELFFFLCSFFFYYYNKTRLCAVVRDVAEILRVLVYWKLVYCSNIASDNKAGNRVDSPPR